MQVESFGTRVKKTTKKFFKTLGIILLIVAVIVFCFLYWATYEEGVMAGKVLRVSEKGMIFKTFEGKINLETFGALRGAARTLVRSTRTVAQSRQRRPPDQ